MKLRNRLLRRRRSLPSGFHSARREIGGAPKVMQWMRLKQPVRMLSSDWTVSESMWEYRRAAMAPPALWPVMSREQEDREGFSSSRYRRRAAMGATIARATLRKPSWQRLPGSSRKPWGETGVVD